MALQRQHLRANMASFDEEGDLYMDNWNHRTVFATSETREEAGPSTLRDYIPSISAPVDSTRSTPSATRPSMTKFKEKWHGIYTDGRHLKYTADAPEVRIFLDEARDTLELPPIDCHFVYTLAAIAVHNKPTDPAHWLFWSGAQYTKTIEIVQSVSRASNNLFFSSDQWTLEKQRRIKNLYQTPKFYDEASLKSKPWYTILVPQPEIEARRTTRGGVERQRQTEIERAKAKDSLVKRGGRLAHQRAPSPKRALTPVSDDNDEETSRWESSKTIHPSRRVARLPKRKTPLVREDSPLTDLSIAPPPKIRCSMSASPQAESDCSSVETLVASPPSKEQKLFRMSNSPVPEPENEQDSAYPSEGEPPAKMARTVRASTRKPKTPANKLRASARPRRIVAGRH